METKIKAKKTSTEMIQYLIEIKKEAQEETKKYINSIKFQEDLKKLRELKDTQK